MEGKTKVIDKEACIAYIAYIIAYKAYQLVALDVLRPTSTLTKSFLFLLCTSLSSFLLGCTDSHLQIQAETLLIFEKDV